ncbi:MAG TPA: ribosome small subunit-dependent GTPase A [Vicinamibacterales bacterium]
MHLAALGWDELFAAAFAALAPGPDVEPARVVIGFNYLYRVWTDHGELDATLSGRLKHRATSRSELPAVGDWVAVRRRSHQDKGAIVAVLSRRSAFSRRMAGAVTDEQVVAANVDIIFVVMGLDADFSIRRLERYLLLAHEGGAAPVIVLTKPDLSDDAGGHVAEVTPVAGAVSVHVVNPRSGAGVDAIGAYLTPGRTGALLGSSGVGKSTIINRLVGADVRKTREVRASDQKGRHTTSHRELVVLPNGGLIIDTPGMRELQLWDVGESVRETFDEIETLAAACRFTDCRHRNEPRCAVKAAVADGSLRSDRLESYLKLQDELVALARQQDERALLEQKRQAKIVGKALKKHYREERS